MPHYAYSLFTVPRAAARLCLIATVLVCAAPSGADESLPYRARFPIPQPILLQEVLGDDVVPEPVDSGADDDDAVVFEPDLTRAAIRTAASHLRARRPVPVDIIRNGFSTRSTTPGAPPERIVGLKLGAEIFSVTTRVIAPPGAEQGRDARIDWRLARPIANAGPGFIWTVSTEGGSGIAARPQQTANLLVGYRHELFEHLTLTSQVSMGGSYVFAPDGRPNSIFVPEVKLTANLAALANLPWETTLDVTLARQVPLAASTFETRGSAMLRLKYSLE